MHSGSEINLLSGGHQRREFTLGDSQMPKSKVSAPRSLGSERVMNSKLEVSSKRKRREVVILEEINGGPQGGDGGEEVTFPKATS